MSDTQQAPCTTTVEDLLREVTKYINNYESQKPGELKSEMETFVKKKQQLVDDYKTKYQTLRDRWSAQHRQIECLYRKLQGVYQEEEWKKIVKDCVCKKLYEQRCQEQLISKRTQCCKGKREQARDTAKGKSDDAKSYLDTICANAQKLESALTEGDTLIKKIQDLVPGPEQAVALYLFWFKLVPNHQKLMPADAPDDCKSFDQDATPELLCASCDSEDCVDTNPCKPSDAIPPSDDGNPPHSVPWLMSPDKYAGELDCAWLSYRDAKSAYGKLESEFKNQPDDLNALQKKLDDYKKSIENVIQECLKANKPADPCPPQPDAQTDKETEPCQNT